MTTEQEAPFPGAFEEQTGPMRNLLSQFLQIALALSQEYDSDPSPGSPAAADLDRQSELAADAPWFTAPAEFIASVAELLLMSVYDHGQAMCWLGGQGNGLAGSHVPRSWRHRIRGAPRITC